MSMISHYFKLTVELRIAHSYCLNAVNKEMFNATVAGTLCKISKKMSEIGNIFYNFDLQVKQFFAGKIVLPVFTGLPEKMQNPNHYLYNVQIVKENVQT